MYTVELYRRVRRAHYVEGRSIRQVAREFNLHRHTVNKMLEYSVPPGYQRQQPPRRPKLDPYIPLIDQILQSDQARPKKQRHTAQRIFQRLRDEHGFSGQYTIVKDYVRRHRTSSQEMFVRLVHPPGHAQADFGEAQVIIDGVLRKAHYLVVDLPYSDAFYVQAYPAETTEAFCDGHNWAFSFFGGVPQTILYDNTKLAVARILEDGKRKRTRVFSELLSHYLFDSRFGRPGKGNDKGKVESLVGYVRRNLFVPLPVFESFDALNAYLDAQCRKRLQLRVQGCDQTIGERLEEERESLIQLPQTPYDAEVLVRGYVPQVVISCGDQVIAQHTRSYQKGDFVDDPIHYLPLLEHKVGALDQAAPLAGWELPTEFDTLRRLLESRMGKRGKREYVQVLRLLETFRQQEVQQGIRDALRLGTIGFDAVKHLLLCRIEGRPPRLDLAQYPYLPRARVETTSTSAYLSLLGGKSL